MNTQLTEPCKEMLDTLNREISELESQELTADYQQLLMSKKDLRDILELNMIPGTGTVKQAFHKAF